LQASLIYASASVYIRNAIDARTALSMIRDASELLPILLENGHTTLAGRLAGAFRNMGRDTIANQIIDTFKQADYDIREEDPFDTKLELKLPTRERSLYANRIRLMWTQMREAVIANFPKAPGIQADHGAFMKDVDDIYLTDAYHSLSIERYRVTPELITKVSSGEWDMEESEDDRKQRDAMAARGYYQAFQSVKESISAILEGANPAIQTHLDHSKWYRQLFDPSVVAGLLKTSDLSGYRNHQVYIGNSKHVPLSVDAMRDTMSVLFELLEEEPEASVRAVLAHFIFVFIHPYMDGNGRMGRFLMNVMLASGGYPWTVIPVESRDEYMKALEKASVEQDIGSFTDFIGRLVYDRLQGKSVAILPDIN
jgi:fido (protein-threonine AMPylation protein)